MTFVIQMRGRHWPESMGWQDTDFQPDDRTPAEWVATMNEGDPQIEYRVVPVVDGRMFLGLDEREVDVVVQGLQQLVQLRADDVAWGSASAGRDLAIVRGVLTRIAALSGTSVELERVQVDQVEVGEAEDDRRCWHCCGTGEIDGERCDHCGGTGFDLEDLEDA